MSGSVIKACAMLLHTAYDEGVSEEAAESRKVACLNAKDEWDTTRAEVTRLTRELEEARSVLIRAQEDYRSAVEGLETYEERIGDIADHVLGLVPPGVPSIVKLDAIERRCGDERVAARQAEAKLEDARAVLREVEWAGRRDWNGYSGFPSCPCCEEYEPGYEGKRASTGHAPDCRLAKVLA